MRLKNQSAIITFFSFFSGDIDVFMTSPVFHAIFERVRYMPIRLKVLLKGYRYLDDDFVVYDITSGEHNRTVQVK